MEDSFEMKTTQITCEEIKMKIANVLPISEFTKP